MKKTKILMALGAIALTAGSFLVTKGNKFFTHITQGGFVASGSQIGTAMNLTPGGTFTTVASGKHVVVLAVTAGASSFTKIATLYTGASSSNKKVYHN